MNQYNAIEDQPVLETRNKSPSTSISKIVAVSVVLSFALGACAATAISYRSGGVTNLAVTENCKTAAALHAFLDPNDQRAATAESACSPFILPAPASTIGKCPAAPDVPVSLPSLAGDVHRESYNPEKIVIGGAMCGDSSVQTNVWVKGPMMDTAKIDIHGTGIGGDLMVQGTMTDDASIFIDAGGGVRNIIVQAEMSGNAKITVVGEVSGGITVASSMSGHAKIEAGSCGKPTSPPILTGSTFITGTGC
ncbi:unnamed protein product [Pelagomonas calceolata]|uniref:Uncharacterized protein n=1 Tax=Pelagomonas calceolata TaxID=35677 RepID=A0A8J2S6P0_9STRA|nr:unnamed protein product [Pelagomonas calceolata]